VGPEENAKKEAKEKLKQKEKDKIIIRICNKIIMAL
jgi:hypothetical protein